jgi:hypothetical protein
MLKNPPNLILPDIVRQLLSRDVNLHPSVGIPVGIAPSGAPKTKIFPPWEQWWREKLPRGDFGTAIGEEAPVPVDSSNPLIA